MRIQCRTGEPSQIEASSTQERWSAAASWDTAMIEGESLPGVRVSRPQLHLLLHSYVANDGG